LDETATTPPIPLHPHGVSGIGGASTMYIAAAEKDAVIKIKITAFGENKRSFPMVASISRIAVLITTCYNLRLEII